MSINDAYRFASGVQQHSGRVQTVLQMFLFSSLDVSKELAPDFMNSVFGVVRFHAPPLTLHESSVFDFVCSVPCVLLYNYPFLPFANLNMLHVMR